MRYTTVITSFVVSIGLFSATLATASPSDSRTRLSCNFESRNKKGGLECWVKIGLCTTEKCHDTFDIECDDGFDFIDKRDVRTKLRHGDLTVRSRKAEVTVKDFTPTNDARLKARLELRDKELRGRCVVKSSETPPPVPTGSCQPSSSLSVLVTGTNVVSYVPKGSWGGSAKGVAAVNVEGSSITNTLIPTTNVVNSCASNPLTGQTVCTANNTDVYLLSGTTLNNTLTSGGSGTISFSGGSCTNCGVAMDATNNRAVIGMAISSAAGFQILNLGTSTFETAFPSPAGIISEDPLIDPVRNLLLSASENGNYEILNIATSTAPTAFENATGGGELDSSGEDCTTGIALAPAEFSSPSSVFIADLTQATFTAGTPGTWSAPSQNQILSESELSAGASGIAVAQGTHLGVVTGEFGGSALTAIALPATSGSGTPAITDWVTCNIDGFSMGLDPHTVTAYQSPNGGNAIALLANGGATTLAVVDLTQMLDPTVVPRTVGGHACASGILPASVVRFVTVP